MKKIPTTVDRKAWKKWLLCPVLALLLVLTSLPVYAGEQKTEVTETPTVTQDTGSESAQSVTSSEQGEIVDDALASQEISVTSTDFWKDIEPYEGIILDSGYMFAYLRRAI